MIRLKLRVFISLVTMFMVTCYEYPEESKYSYKLHNNKKLRETFDKLLHRVTNLNKERLYSLKKFNDLQNYRPKVGLRTSDEIVAVIIPGTAALKYDYDENDIHKRINIARDATLETSDERDKDDYLKDSKETGLKETDPLRQWKGCTKSAAKHCRIACKRAYKATCEDYNCSKSMKKAHKKKCNNECNSEFSYDADDY